MKGIGYYYHDYLGVIEIREEVDGISDLNFIASPKDIEKHRKENKEVITKEIEKAKKELDEYFKGKRKEFTVKIDIRKGTQFQRSCWQSLTTIPYGETISYKEESIRIGREKACRAVGGANGKNPISIILPCHRVIGASGKLTGYGSGIWRKEYLLKLEKKEI